MNDVTAFTWALWEHKLFLRELQPAERMPWSRRASPPAGAGTSDRWKREALPPKKKERKLNWNVNIRIISCIALDWWIQTQIFLLLFLIFLFWSQGRWLNIQEKNTLQINGPFGFRKLHTSIVSWFFLISRLVCSNRTSSVLVCSSRRSVFFDWLHNADDGPLENRNNENPIFRWRKKGNN